MKITAGPKVVSWSNGNGREERLCATRKELERLIRDLEESGTRYKMRMPTPNNRGGHRGQGTRRRSRLCHING